MEAIARRKTYLSPHRIQAAATTHEVMELFALSRPTIGVFDEALVFPGRGSYPKLFSRARIVQLLSSWNDGRVIPYPCEPWLTSAAAADFLAELGENVTSTYLQWLSSPAGRIRMGTKHLSVKIGRHSRRYRPSDLIRFAATREDGR